jgi:hypothetical protein
VKVLGISADWGSGFLKTVRMEMPLANLKRQRLIEDYTVTDPFLRHVDPAARFDAVWLQRIDDTRLLSTLRTTIQSRYLYDIDDYLLGRAAYLEGPLTRARHAVHSALEACAQLTMPSHRLRAMLEATLACRLDHKTAICPNGSEFAYGLKPNQPPAGVIWVSSVNAALTESRAAVVAAIAGFVRRHRLPMWFVGTPAPDVLAACEGMRCLGTMSYWHYIAWLASCPPMIAVAPLETAADPDTLAVIQGKSDVKMAEYAGFGHLGVFSDSPPYRESDLGVGCLTNNTHDAWEASLEQSAAERWETRSEEQERVVSVRHMNRISRECWLPAIENVRLDAPLRADDILPHARRGVVMRDLIATLNANSSVYRAVRSFLPRRGG